MKFRVFGGADCPDFLLAQLAVISNITNIEIIEMFTTHAINHLLNVGSTKQENESVTQELLQHPKLSVLEPADIAQAVVAIHTLTTSIVQFQVPHDVSVNELTMLGVSPEAADCIVGHVQAKMAQLYEVMIAHHTPMMQGLQVSADKPPSILYDENGNAMLVELSFTRTMREGGVNVTEPVQFHLTPQKLQALLSELVTARETLRAAVNP